ncbi:MAG: hypothetical protein IKZ59_00340, partial [Clostridia bacterium]|nr:hypothetical protein [Clostridia bacterium]
IPALCMLLVSAILLGTSTYAWFSMSTEVTATGMSVTAVSDAIFLEIAGVDDAGTYSLTGTSTVAADLYPAHHEAWTAKANIIDFDLNDDSTNDNWYYRYNANSDNATNAMTAKNYIDSFTGYVAQTTYSVKLRANSADTGYDLYVSDITIPDNKGITVVIAGENGYKEFSASASDIAFNAADILSDTVTQTAQTINVYVYFNGDDTNVYTDNATALTGAVSFNLQAFVNDHV